MQKNSGAFFNSLFRLNYFKTGLKQTRHAYLKAFQSPKPFGTKPSGSHGKLVGAAFA
jgi:hypothetical protein